MNLTGIEKYAQPLGGVPPAATGLDQNPLKGVERYVKPLSPDTSLPRPLPSRRVVAPKVTSRIIDDDVSDEQPAPSSVVVDRRPAQPIPQDDFTGGEFRVRVGPNDTQRDVQLRLLNEATAKAGLNPLQQERFTSEWHADNLAPLVTDEQFAAYQKLGEIPVNLDARSSPEFFRRIGEYRKGTVSTTPDNLDLRVMKGEQPEDRQAFARSQEAGARTEPKPTQVIEDDRPSFSARTPSLYERAKEAVAPYTPGLQNLNTQEGIKTTAVEEGALSAINTASLGLINLHVDPSRFHNERERQTAEIVGLSTSAVMLGAGAGGALGKLSKLVKGEGLTTLGLGAAEESAAAESRLSAIADDVEQRLGVRPHVEAVPDGSIKVTGDFFRDGDVQSYKIMPGMKGALAVEPAAVPAAGAHRLKENIYSLLSLPRSIETAGDLSATGRQAAVVAAGHPVRGVQAFVKGAQAFGSEAKAREVLDWVRDRPLAQLWKEHGLFTPDLEDPSLTFAMREEAYGSRLANKFPLVKRSERAFNVTLNYLRASVADDLYRTHPGMTTNDLREVARTLNVMTGRGSLGPLEKYAAGTAQVIFAPRLLASRIQTPALLLSKSPIARKEAARNLVSFVGANLGFLGLAKMAGADVELDPRSTDFLRAKFGDTRVDFSSGYQAPLRYAAQLLMGQSKNVDTGEIRNAPRWGTLEKQGTGMRLIRTRLAPQVGLPLDVALGKNVAGERVTPQSAALSGIEYLSARDIYEAVQADRKHGGTGARGAALGSLSILGVGVSTYGKGAQESKPISYPQKSYIHNLSSDSNSESRRLFNKPVDELNTDEASKLIDELKKQKSRPAVTAPLRGVEKYARPLN